MSKEKEQAKTPDTAQKMRQVLIETDGNQVRITKAEVAGNLELVAILNSVLTYLANLPKQ